MKHVSPISVETSRAATSVLEILESFDRDHPKQSLSEISRRLSIPKATAYRYLKALARRGYLRVDGERKRYALGSRLLELAEQHYQQFDLLGAVRPILAELAAATGETAHYGILEANEIVYIEIAESPQRVRAYVHRGDRLPAHCVAAGKAILAYSSPDLVDRFCDRFLAKLTEATIVDPQIFRQELNRTRRRGYGVNCGEWIAEVTAVSAPVFAPGRGVTGAIGVAGPTARLPRARIAPIGNLVREHAARLTELMGSEA
jgi:DNA-binding IclR family transcriptional regulator